MKTLVISQEKCTACRRCELACSFRQTGEFNPAASRVTTAIFIDEDFYLPVTCQHCEEPLCQKACPSGAIFRNEITRAVEIKRDRCIGCRMCVMVCPFGACAYSEAEQRVVKCDLCGGEPECAVFCPWGAIEYKEADRSTLAKRKQVGRKLRDILKEVSA